MGYAFASMGGKGKLSNRWICMLKRHSQRAKSEVKAATGLDSIFPAVPRTPASLCSVPDSYAYNQLERHYPQRAVGVQPIEDPSIVADRDVAVVSKIKMPLLLLNLILYVLTTFVVSLLPNSLWFHLISAGTITTAFMMDPSGAGGDVPALESSSSSESLGAFRAQIAGENEAEIYQRIRLIESHQYYNLPPQNAPGDYEQIVREHFDQARSVNHFREILDREYFELQVLERKGLLQDRLHSLMLGEPNLGRILEISPFTDIRSEAYHYIEDQVSAVSSLRHTFQRDRIP
ncbi:hypothetical protein CASFOL_009507 [Castilleja foliolosa]|uniref:Uncharacterized protein n=1 Tax=Castilleja foliolosa TaxID=1961234 RepID=A0ABD3E086_9LAMI